MSQTPVIQLRTVTLRVSEPPPSTGQGSHDSAHDDYATTTATNHAPPRRVNVQAEEQCAERPPHAASPDAPKSCNAADAPNTSQSSTNANADANNHDNDEQPATSP